MSDDALLVELMIKVRKTEDGQLAPLSAKLIAHHKNIRQSVVMVETIVDMPSMSYLDFKRLMIEQFNQVADPETDILLCTERWVIKAIAGARMDEFNALPGSKQNAWFKSNGWFNEDA